MQTYEVEIKALLGTPERADQLREALKKVDPNAKLVSQNKQRNHYFIDGDVSWIRGQTDDLLSAEALERLDDIGRRVKAWSVRTRDEDGTVYLVVKASVDDTSSENGIARVEFQEKVPCTLEEIDQRLRAAFFNEQAKWSREREEYVVNGVNVCLDKNAGYGYVAEFERVVEDASQLENAQQEVRALMEAAGVEELPQERLKRMFDHYNENWESYYGTDKIFVIE